MPMTNVLELKATQGQYVYRGESTIHEGKILLEAKDVLPNIKPHAGRRKGRKMPFFVPDDLDL